MRVLMLAEAVTLAHVARLITLGRSLPAQGIETCIATSPARRAWVESEGLQFHAMRGVEPVAFVRALAEGRAVYDLPTLRAYVQDDLKLIETHRPDVVVGDFRLSLSVSARLARVPYLTVTNAYWSPHVRLPFPMPVLPLSRRLPLPVAQCLFSLGRPFVMPLHARPMNQLRREHGMPSFGANLRRAYTDADTVLYADGPDFFPMDALPSSHHFLGPLLWAPPIDLPDWWGTLDGSMPVVYVTLGSSGSDEVLRVVLDALAGEPVQVIASTAGGALPQGLAAKNVHCAPYLPGDRASERASLVICNGGSMTTQQALVLGRPVLGIPSNMDQFMNMVPIVESGAGRSLRADRVSGPAVRGAVRDLLSSEAARGAARALGDRLSRTGSPVDRFVALLRSSLG